MFILGPTDNGNTTDLGSSSKDKRKTVDSRFDTKEGDFGGNRKVSSTPAKATDYKRPTLGAPNRTENPVEDTIRDIDDPNDPQARKRQVTRDRELTDLAYRTDLDYVSVSGDNMPLEDTDAFEPDPSDPEFLRRRSKLKSQFGDGQYEGEIS